MKISKPALFGAAALVCLLGFGASYLQDDSGYSAEAEGARPVLAQMAETGLVDADDEDSYSVDSDAVLELLENIPDRESDNEVPGYSVNEFGSSWADTDKNGCGQRNDVLARDFEAESIEYRDGTHQCVVVRGILHDVYTGEEIHFTKADAIAVQIDHIVARSWAWQNGAAEWSADQRLDFATDLTNLQAVDGPINGSKSDDGPGTGEDQWLPPNDDYICMFLARFTFVVSEYELTLPPADRAGIEAGLEQCSISS